MEAAGGHASSTLCEQVSSQYQGRANGQCRPPVPHIDRQSKLCAALRRAPKVHVQAKRLWHSTGLHAGRSRSQSACPERIGQHCDESERRRLHRLGPSSHNVSKPGSKGSRVLQGVQSFEGHSADELSGVVGGSSYGYGLRLEASHCKRVYAHLCMIENAVLENCGTWTQRLQLGCSLDTASGKPDPTAGTDRDVDKPSTQSGSQICAQAPHNAASWIRGKKAAACFLDWKGMKPTH